MGATTWRSTSGIVAATVFAVALSACGGATEQSPPTVQPSPTSIPPTATPTTIPTLTPTDVPPPTLTPISITATPVTALPMRIAAQLDPPTPRAGEEFVLALSVTNDGQRQAHGVYIATNGPWDRWTVLGVEPDGIFASDAAGWHIVSSIPVPPAETRTILVHTRADEPAQEQLTFAVREAEPLELPTR